MYCHICRAAGFLCGKCRQEKENERCQLKPGEYKYNTTTMTPKVSGPRYGERRR